MNRQQALGQPGDRSLERAGINGLVNDIYDDFESQTCGNCIHYGEWEYEIPGAEDFTATATGCTPLRLRAPSLDFGCNQFERAE